MLKFVINSAGSNLKFFKTLALIFKIKISTLAHKIFFSFSLSYEIRSLKMLQRNIHSLYDAFKRLDDTWDVEIIAYGTHCEMTRAPNSFSFCFLSSSFKLLLCVSIYRTSSDFSSELDEERVTSLLLCLAMQVSLEKSLYRKKMFIFVVIGNFFR